MSGRVDRQGAYRSGAALLAASVPLLLWVAFPIWPSQIDPAVFLLLHTLLEVGSVVIALTVFITGSRAILSGRLRGIALLGVGFLGVGLLDFLHLMSYAGMPDVWSPNTPQKSMFFWLAARVLASSSLLFYVLWRPGVDISVRHGRAVAAMLSVVAVLACVGLGAPERLPALFVGGVGLTPLKISIELMAVGLNVVTLWIMWLRREQLAGLAAQAIFLAVALSAVSDLFMTMLGVVDKDEANLFGHFYKAVAYLYLFRATFDEAIRHPIEQIETQNQREKVTLSAAADGVLWVDPRGQILMANPAMARISGHAAESLVGQNVDILLPAGERSAHADLLRRYFSQPKARRMGSTEIQLLRGDGATVPVDISLDHWEDHGVPYAIAFVRDLTERRRYEESLRHQATHDELTGLPNRWLFMLQLNIAIAKARHTGERVAVMFLDLDYFKAVNDSFGHATGDELLTDVGRRIRSVLRDADTVARMGGDEFAFLLTELGTTTEVTAIAELLLSALQASYLLGNRELHSGGSLGIAVYPDDAEDSDTLLRYADIAMYQAKEAGRGGYSFYSKEMDRRSHEDMQLHVRLKDAFANGSLRLHYQPQFDVKTDTIVGAEALLRWHDPVLGDVAPGRFIPIAEASGLINPLSDWVLETACLQAAEWVRQGTPLVVAINISVHQFRQTSLVEKVEAVLKRTGANAHHIGFEITESVAMTHPQQARGQIDALVALGCKVSLDDFGTGYSSLSYLKALQVGTLKIDKSFMDGIPDDASDLTICKAIIGLAHSLGMKVVAEGVENQLQLDFLKLHGCEVFQGWLRAKAMSAHSLTDLLARTGARLGADVDHRQPSGCTSV